MNSFGHGVGIGENIFCGDAQHSEALRLEPIDPGIITSGPVAHVVGDPVYFDRELGRGAVKIEDVRTDWVLAADARAR